MHNNQFINIAKMLKEGNSTWEFLEKNGLANLDIDYDTQNGPPFMTHNGRQFINMISCSYLGLDRHPNILRGASEAIHEVGSMHLTSPRSRLQISMLHQVEDALAKHFSCKHALIYPSCSAATSTFLPLYASGCFSDNNKPLMIFDKHAHFSIKQVKPICGDETKIITCEHNDLDFIESICKKHKNVAYITEGAYSINGCAPLADLKELQDKYGLFLYFDDSHGLSVIGNKGEGYILDYYGSLNNKTVVVGSLAKAFGACGGTLLLSDNQMREKLIRFGSSWSQCLNSAGLGAIKSSIKIHETQELRTKQEQWSNRLAYIDRFLGNQLSNRNTLLPTRVVFIQEFEKAVELTQQIFAKGYFCGTLFFPTIARNSFGLRFMPRADMSMETISDFCTTLQNYL